MMNLDKKALLNDLRHYIFPEIAHWLRFVLRISNSYLAATCGPIGAGFFFVVYFTSDSGISIFQDLGSSSPELMQTVTYQIVTLLTAMWFIYLGAFAFIVGRFPFSAKTSNHPEKIAVARSAFPSIEGESK
ncbi:hypothetical protein L6172_14665 [Thalassospiraceae bacterium SW-3-3]|nr:hypothetical protein L6172_14665 [Thalassospiraceae bacterium SW-3-3]